MPAKVAKAPKRSLSACNELLSAEADEAPLSTSPGSSAGPLVASVAKDVAVDEFFHLPDESAAPSKKLKQWMRLDAAVVLVWYEGGLLAGLIAEAGPTSGKETPGYLRMQAQGGYRWIIPVKSGHWLARALPTKFASTWGGQRVYHAKGLVVGCKGGSDVDPATIPLVMEELKMLAQDEGYKADVARIRVDITDAEAEALVSRSYDKADPTTKCDKCPLPRF